MVVDDRAVMRQDAYRRGGELSFRRARQAGGVTVLIEFLCETGQVQPRRIFKPKGEFTGTKLGASMSAAPSSPGTTTSNASSAASVSICHSSVGAPHAGRWLPPLEFDQNK